MCKVQMCKHGPGLLQGLVGCGASCEAQGCKEEQAGVPLGA